jgi:tetratricopeptide (TPR) repeat protein
VKPLKYQNNLAWAYAHLGEYEQAIVLWNGTLERNPDYLFAYMGLTLAYQLSGNEAMARESATEVMRIKPNLTISKIARGPATKNVDRKRMLEEMRKAGIPE